MIIRTTISSHELLSASSISLAFDELTLDKPDIRAQTSPMMHFLRLICLVAGLVFANAASAQDVEVDAELFLAVDVSRSMTPRELEIQRRGYAEALVSEPVISAIKKGLIGRIAITYVEWAGTFSQREVVGWTLISSADDARAFALKLTAQFDAALRRTSISGALDYAAGTFATNGYTSNRRIIDISGDGPNNQGRPVLGARDDALAKGIVINGLPLMTREGMGSQWHLEDLDEYYRNCVVGGPASFVIPVRKWDEFPAAVRQKLVLELAGRTPDGHNGTVIRIQASPPYDCEVGEKIWRQLRQNWFQWRP